MIHTSDASDEPGVPLLALRMEKPAGVSLCVRVSVCVFTCREEAGLPPVCSPTLPRLSATIAVVSCRRSGRTAKRDNVHESILDSLQRTPFRPWEAEDIDAINGRK